MAYTEIAMRQSERWDGTLVYSLHFLERNKQGNIVSREYDDVGKRAYMNTFFAICWMIGHRKDDIEIRQRIHGNYSYYGCLFPKA